MTIIETLGKRSEIAKNDKKDDVKIDVKLYTLAHDLEKMARVHLKRITRILPEFDIHDEKHSEKVILNIEQLLGDKIINALSAYELFLLHLAAFFHDCAMAPSDWEINLLKLTEGTSLLSTNNNSIKNDLNAPLKLSTAITFIEKSKKELYHEFKGDVKGWMFSPQTEHQLIEYLAALLIDYQNFRNGFADKIRTVKTQAEFEDLNIFIRTDYIRATHHSRIEVYVKNLVSIFSEAFEQPAWGKKLVNDLALICRSHGEDVNFIKNFDINSQYYGSAICNLQFVAIMLRLGDIIHFSFDRAPVELRSSRLFKSEYSFSQWAIKNSGVNYSIEKGQISYRAYCDNPEMFFNLHEYVNWIEAEIQSYYKFERYWKTSYIENLQDKVNRINIKHNSNVFLPKRGLSFSLNQKKTIELLMGVGLYKDKFACLRELYQNSLDACKCMISQSKLEQRTSNSSIEFSIQIKNNETFLCCTDNGIGMDKNIIETYLLNIGNSYYKSSDFFKHQAKWGGTFTPTSQFGIGILSCFMIGTKIKIITKKSGGDYISCSINGPHENFYYTPSSEIEKESIPISGTVVKILLNKEVEALITSSKIEKVGLLMMREPSFFSEEFQNYRKYYSIWSNHLYNKVNSFVKMIPQDISVKIRFSDNSTFPIISKPVILDENMLGLTTEDIPYLDFLNKNRRFYPLEIGYSDLKKSLSSYEIEINQDDIQYKTILLLPNSELISDELYFDLLPQIGGYGICIDGIDVSNTGFIGFEHYYSMALIRSGIMNFIGEIRPQLSVDRTSLVSFPSSIEVISKKIVTSLLQSIIDKTQLHISKHNIQNKDSIFSLIWKYIFDKIEFADTLFINELSYTKYGNIKWEGLNEIISEDITIKDFLLKEEIKINNFTFFEWDVLSKKLVLFKLFSANDILVLNKNSIQFRTKKLYKTQLLDKRNDLDKKDILISSNNHGNVFNEYDVISNLYPIIPENLFNLIQSYGEGKVAGTKTKYLMSYSNGITSFFHQDPLLIDESLGMYIAETDAFGKEEKRIYNFEKKRSKIQLFRLNDRLHSENSNNKYTLTAFISPSILTKEQSDELEKIKQIHPTYYKGVKEGWSILVTGMEKYNTIIISGKSTRKELIDKIPDIFWREYQEITFKFPNGSIMKKSL